MGIFYTLLFKNAFRKVFTQLINKTINVWGLIPDSDHKVIVLAFLYILCSSFFTYPN